MQGRLVAKLDTGKGQRRPGAKFTKTRRGGYVNGRSGSAC